jgi:hypothetical protein
MLVLMAAFLSGQAMNAKIFGNIKNMEGLKPIGGVL